MSLKDRYENTWGNVQSDCMLCQMEKRTEWYIETPRFVVAEKLGGGPFVVYKTHKKELSGDEWDAMEHTVSRVFGNDFEVRVRMNLVRDHWHGHIVSSGRDVNLHGE